MKKIFLISMMIFSFSTFGQSNPDNLIQTFFKDYEKNPSKAVEDFYSTNVWALRNRDGIER